MTKEKAKEIIYENTPLDSIVEIIPTPDFIEITGKAGGDYLTYRVYNNGTLSQR